MKNRAIVVLSVLLSVAMMLGMCPTRGFAEEASNAAIVEVDPADDEQTAQIQGVSEGEGVIEAESAETAVVAVTFEDSAIAHPYSNVVYYDSLDVPLYALNLNYDATDGDDEATCCTTLDLLRNTSVPRGYEGVRVWQANVIMNLNGKTTDLNGWTIHAMGTASKQKQTVTIRDAQGSGVLDNCTIKVSGHVYGGEPRPLLVIDNIILNGGIEIGDVQDRGYYYHGEAWLQRGTINGYVTVKVDPADAYNPGTSMFTMSGGTVNGGVTLSSTRSGTFAQLNISGGTITNNDGVGVSVGENSMIKVSGAPTIVGSKGGNVCLSEGTVITVAGRLADGASIGVTTAVKPTAQNPVVEFTSGYGEQNRNDDPSKFFTSDDPKYCVTWNDSKTEAVLRYHQHDWSYDANGNVLTATCANANCSARGGNVQTLTLSAKSKAHDGKAAVATIATSEGWESTGAAAGDVAYYQGAKRLDGAPVDAGDYEARAAVQTAAGQKTVAAPFSITRDPATVPASVVAHLQRIGTLPASTGVGQLVGTTGQSRRLESLRLSLAGQPLAGGVEYRAHVQRVGWQGWRADGEMAGTEGRSRRLEAVQIALTGQMGEQYDVYYRVHVQRYGWMAWAKNGKPAGTTGESRRAEAVQIVVQRKGSPAPGATYGGITQTFNKAFEKR